MMDYAAARRKCGQNLAHFREEQRLSIPALAALSGLEIETIDSIENGDTDFDISVLFKVADALHVDFRQLIVDPDFVVKS